MKSVITINVIYPGSILSVIILNAIMLGVIIVREREK